MIFIQLDKKKVVAVDKIKEWLKEGYDTIAVICKDEEEAISVQKQLKGHLPIQESSSK